MFYAAKNFKNNEILVIIHVDFCGIWNYSDMKKLPHLNLSIKSGITKTLHKLDRLLLIVKCYFSTIKKL